MWTKIFFSAQPTKSILKKPRAQNIVFGGCFVDLGEHVDNIQQILHDLNRGIVIRMEQLDLSKFNVDHDVSKQPKTLPDKYQRISVCQNCADSFDPIFNAKREQYLAPYMKTLDEKIKLNEVADKELEEINQQWYEESQKWAELAHKLDQMQDKYTASIQKNYELRLLVENISKTILKDHSYSCRQN